MKFMQIHGVCKSSNIICMYVLVCRMRNDDTIISNPLKLLKFLSVCIEVKIVKDGLLKSKI